MICALIVVALLSGLPARMCLNEGAAPIFMQWIIVKENGHEV